jgi:2-hydroxycyclohexanecarboxyl-CoA dehydrogenase
MKARFEGDGDVVVITGGANGIGRALALAAADIGARVFICDIDEAAMATLAGNQSGLSGLM